MNFIIKANGYKNHKPDVSGSKANVVSRETLLQAICNLPHDQDFLWDGYDEDERPVSEDELKAAVPAYRQQRG